MPAPAAPRVPGAVLAAVMLLAGGCNSQPETVVDSDVPQIVGLESRHASGIEREGDVLMGGHFVYRGEVANPAEMAADTAKIYREHGWTLESSNIGSAGGRMVFVKDDRTVYVDLKANLLDPSMGSGTVDVTRTGETPTGPGTPGRTRGSAPGGAEPAPTRDPEGPSMLPPPAPPPAKEPPPAGPRDPGAAPSSGR